MSAALARLQGAVERGLETLPTVRVGGHIIEVTPSACRVAGLSHMTRLGDCIALDPDGRSIGEAVRLDPDAIVVKPFDRLDVGIGHSVFHAGTLSLAPDASWKGRVVNALGAPLDDLGDLAPGPAKVAIDAPPPAAMARARVTAPLKTGVRAIDLFTPICAGQRIGIFAGSGVGKSSLLSMLARASAFDAVVVALVGERGREVREFLDDALAPSRHKAVVVVSTGDESAMMRRLAPRTATAIAEYFRDRGESVLLIVDSMTRFAHAAREVALATGEPAVARGYTPSVFSDLPRLLERAGPGAAGGAITGVFSVLVDGDDHNDPVADTMRGILDGHIVLDRAIASAGRFPAVDVLQSLSRLAPRVWSPEQRALITKLRALVARFEDTRDLRAMGGVQPGQDPELDQAISIVPKIYDALVQDVGAAPSDDAFRDLAERLQAARRDG